MTSEKSLRFRRALRNDLVLFTAKRSLAYTAPLIFDSNPLKSASICNMGDNLRTVPLACPMQNVGQTGAS